MSESDNVCVRAKKVHAYEFTITGLAEDDYSNIIIGLQLLVDSLEPESIQRIQADHLQHFLKGQRDRYRRAPKE